MNRVCARIDRGFYDSGKGLQISGRLSSSGSEYERRDQDKECLEMRHSRGQDNAEDSDAR